jgi:hypothetical protein
LGMVLNIKYEKEIRSTGNGRQNDSKNP